MTRICPGCREPLPPPATTGRPRRYHDGACRMRAKRRKPIPVEKVWPWESVSEQAVSEQESVSEPVSEPSTGTPTSESLTTTRSSHYTSAKEVTMDATKIQQAREQLQREMGSTTDTMTKHREMLAKLVEADRLRNSPTPVGDPIIVDETPSCDVHTCSIPALGFVYFGPYQDPIPYCHEHIGLYDYTPIRTAPPVSS